jgi:hypothetical protein
MLRIASTDRRAFLPSQRLAHDLLDLAELRVPLFDGVLVSREVGIDK